MSPGLVNFINWIIVQRQLHFTILSMWETIGNLYYLPFIDKAAVNLSLITDDIIYLYSVLRHV